MAADCLKSNQTQTLCIKSIQDCNAFCNGDDSVFTKAFDICLFDACAACANDDGDVTENCLQSNIMTQVCV